MKTCGVTSVIWVNSEQRAVVHKLAKWFEQLNKMPVVIIQDAELNGELISSGNYTKYYAWRFVPKDIERIVYFDIDVLPLRPLPTLPSVDFAAGPDPQSSYDAVNKHWPVLQRAGCFFNCGFFVATRKTEIIFERMLIRQTHAVGASAPWFMDRSLFNVEIQAFVEEGEITFELLPRYWCPSILKDPESPTESPYMLHFSGEKLAKLRLISHIITQFMERADGVKITR